MNNVTKILLALTISFIIIAGSCGSGPAVSGSNELDLAIRETSDYLNKNIPKGKTIVILNIQSDSAALSDYIIDGLIENTVNDKMFEVVDRQQLDLIRAEQNFQLSGEVDDNLAQKIGKFFGAQTIVSGKVSPLGSQYRMSIRALEVETARVQGQYNRNIKAETVTALLGEKTQTTAAKTTDIQAAIEYYNKGTIYYKNRNYDGAISELTQAIRLNPNYAEAYCYRSYAYYFKGNYDQSIADATQAIRLNPNYADAYSTRGAAYHVKRNYDAAIADTTKAIQIDPNHANAYCTRSGANNDKRNFDAGIADATKAIQINPNFGDAYFNRGISHFEKGSFDKAIADWEAAVKINPNDQEAKDNIIKAQQKLGQKR